MEYGGDSSNFLLEQQFLLRQLVHSFPECFKDLKTLHRKEHYFLPIGPKAYIYPVLSGCLLPFRTSMDGRNKCTHLIGRYDLIGISGFGGNQRVLEVCPLTDSKVARIRSARVEKALRGNVELSFLFLKHVCRRFSSSLDSIEASSLFSLKERLEMMNTELTEMQIPNITDIEAGWIVGAHPVSVSREKNKKENEVFA
jgi:CRP-like cAMP-binding protein